MMKIAYRRHSRNFTGDDLAAAEKDMNAAWQTYQNTVSNYNYVAAGDPGSYPARVKETVKNSAKEQYDIAKTRYDDMLKAIQYANEVDYASVQQSLVKQTIVDTTTGTPATKDYSTYLYIGAAVVVLILIIKS